MSISQDDISEKQAVREQLVETSYIGTHSQLKGTSGEAFFHLQNGYWGYRPFGWENFVKITNPSDLDCNAKVSWIRCTYDGINPSIRGTKGKATFNEEINAWLYKPEGSQMEYRIVNDSSFNFIRDKDVNLGTWED